MNEKNKLLKQKLREKYASEGFEALTEKEKIALLLSYSSSGDLEELSDALIRLYSSLTAVIDADMHSLMKNPGLDEKTVVLLRMIPQLSRIYFMKNSGIEVLAASRDAVRFFESYFIGAPGEQLAAVCTDRDFKIIACSTICRGSAASANVSCREIADFALKNGSSRIFIAHNHPTGSAAPSASDYSATDRIFRALDKLGIRLIDHIIVGKCSAVSMRELPYSLPFKNADACGYNFTDTE